MRVVFAGLGAMGYPMAGRVASRFPTGVWNRTVATAERHSAEFGTEVVAPSGFEHADVIVSCLASSAVVAEVVDLVARRLSSGAVWVDCTSGRPQRSRDLADRLAGAGVDYLDAPVSGMAAGARAGTLTAIVGGSESALDRARPVLDSMCTRVIRVGDVGTGHLVKAANNTLFAGTFWLAAEVVARLRESGVDVQRAMDAVNASSGRSFVTQNFLPDYVLPVPAPSSYRLGQSHRDVETLLQAAGPGADPTAPAELVAWLAAAYAERAAALGADCDAAAAFESIGGR
jgi:3-hydroxyisobutyrate dehydrogenase